MNSSVLFCVLHTRLHGDRYDAVMGSWGGGVDILFYSDHAGENIVQVSDCCEYGSNEGKHVAAVQYVARERKGYDWYLFCDNDTFVNVPLLMSCVGGFDVGQVVGSLIRCWSGDWSFGYLSGGAGYLVSGEVLGRLGSMVNYMTGYSDVSMGLNLRELGVPMVDDGRFHSQPPSVYGVGDGAVREHLTFHYILGGEMKRLWGLVR